MTSSTNFTNGTVVSPAWANTMDANVFDYKVNVKDFGAVGDGVTDDIAAFEAAIAALPVKLDAPYYSAKGVVEVSPGTYYLSRTLNIEHQLILRGTGSPMGNGYGACRLKFPTGVLGVAIHSAQSSSTGKDAAGTLIENLTITTTRGSAALEAGKYGVYARTKFCLRNTLVSLFGDAGVFITGEAGVTGNVNNWYLDRCRIAENGYAGLYVLGPDANAGTAVSVDCGSNLGIGIRDSSFLGNTYIGCHTNANTTYGFYTTNANAYSMFLGCYSEGGETNLVNHPALILGGILATANTGDAASLSSGTGNDLRVLNAALNPYTGIDFGNTTVSATTTNLDRYKEGTWTPTVANITLAAGAPSSATYSGTYTVVGNIVHWNIIVTPANTTTVAFTTNSTTFTLPGSYTPTTHDTGVVSSITGATAAIAVVKSDGKVYPRNYAATNDSIVLSGTYLIAT